MKRNHLLSNVPSGENKRTRNSNFNFPLWNLPQVQRCLSVSGSDTLPSSSWTWTWIWIWTCSCGRSLKNSPRWSQWTPCSWSCRCLAPSPCLRQRTSSSSRLFCPQIFYFPWWTKRWEEKIKQNNGQYFTPFIRTVKYKHMKAYFLELEVDPPPLSLYSFFALSYCLFASPAFTSHSWRK